MFVFAASSPFVFVATTVTHLGTLRQDLAVKIEGTFILRYRVFDLFSKASGSRDLTVQAECYGGTFRVYSTKEFPGLQASTELTKVGNKFASLRDRFILSASCWHAMGYALTSERTNDGAGNATIRTKTISLPVRHVQETKSGETRSARTIEHSIPPSNSNRIFTYQVTQPYTCFPRQSQ